MTAKNSEIVRFWVERVWNQGDWAALADCHPETFQNEGRASTIAEAQAWHERTRATFPDIHYTIDETMVTEARVAFRWTATGTHQGSLWGFVQPTEKVIRWNGMHMVGIENGRISEVWVISDTLAQLQQMGVQLQPPE
ncbi:MAG: ester cyclase [Chloroflexota bacterium]